ncbi:SIMPL domain-containing protein [Bosea sp. (in: a-proteobacteria)]|uniref:SIMPL domain-containing protein n=1 Tax=Bosea sp. (in: a-proteobacteria) TaxID=1871050 RepID=UPI0026244694|nr:SIMPL domain-containing protein [Bosea sp. (in: a-proteobacteria)]MCO5092804.1 SIMPL domain-containing protein [Bosea sp. (in: a-proteobacteria)]
MPYFHSPAFAGAAFFAATTLFAMPAAAQEPAAGRPPPRISVAGEGEVAVAPDMAILNLTVLREAETARAALTANSEAMRQVLAALKEAGIAARDLQTSRLSIQPHYSEPGKDRNVHPRITGYSVGNTLTVRVRNLADAGTILDKAVGLGVNAGGGIAFVKDDLGPTLTEARKRAVADALARAGTLAEAAGVKLGRVLSIEDHSTTPQPVQFSPIRRMAAEAVPLEGGENSYRTQVTVVFEIAP